MNRYFESGDISLLRYLAASLYTDSGNTYSSLDTQKRADLFKPVPERTLKSVGFLFTAWQNTILDIDLFSVLFTRSDKPDTSDNGKLQIGNSEIIYSLAKSGYGTLAEVTNMPLFDYLSIQVKNLKDAVQSLRAAKLNDGQISKQLGLDFKTVKLL